MNERHKEKVKTVTFQPDIDTAKLLKSMVSKASAGRNRHGWQTRIVNDCIRGHAPAILNVKD